MVKVSHYIKYENTCTFKDLVKIRFNRGLVRFSFTSCNADNLKSELNWKQLSFLYLPNLSININLYMLFRHLSDS